jgi:hypothetical protein
MEEAETVADRHASHFVVRKRDAVRGIVEKADPRGR